MKLLPLGASIALVSLSLLSGCDKLTEKLGQKAAEKAIEGASGGDVKVDTSNGGVTVTDKKTGAVSQAGVAAKLPDGWPSSVPIYPGSVVRTAMVASGGKTVTLSVKDPPAKVVEFYKKSSLELESEMDLGGQHMMNFKNGSGNAIVMVGEAGSETMVSLTLTD